MNDTLWWSVIVGLNLVALVVVAVALVHYLTKISDAVATANGILLGALADRQQASIVDEIPVGERTRSQQAYVDRRDADDEATRTAERREDFERGGESGQGG